MIDIPPDVTLKASIRPGSVYFFRQDSFSSEYRHYFVVLNADPSSDRVILLVCASSQLAKAKARRENCPPETLVLVSHEQYTVFPYPSLFDCNFVLEQSLDKLTQKLRANELDIMPEIDMQIVGQLRRRVLASREVAGRIKAMLRIPPRT